MIFNHRILTKESTCSDHSFGFCVSPYVFLQTLAIPSPLTTSHRSVKPPDDHRLLDDSQALSRNSHGVLLRKFDGSGPKYASDQKTLPQAKMAMEHPPCSTGNPSNGGSFFIATLVFREGKDENILIHPQGLDKGQNGGPGRFLVAVRRCNFSHFKDSESMYIIYIKH